MITYDDVLDAIEQFKKLSCYDQTNMRLSVGSADRNFKVLVELYSRFDVESLPGDVDGIGVIYRYSNR